MPVLELGEPSKLHFQLSHSTLSVEELVFKLLMM